MLSSLHRVIICCLLIVLSSAAFTSCGVTTPSQCKPSYLFIDGFGNVRGKVHTADGKYIIYSAGNQYGTSYMEVRDASTCEVVLERKWAMSPMEGSSNGLVAVAPETSRLITGRGELVDLDDLEHRFTLAEPEWAIVSAAWSADESYLGYIACQNRVCALHVAFGDGSKPQELSSVETNRQVKWTDNNLVVAIQYYYIDSHDEEIQVDRYFHAGE